VDQGQHHLGVTGGLLDGDRHEGQREYDARQRGPDGLRPPGDALQQSEDTPAEQREDKGEDDDLRQDELVRLGLAGVAELEVGAERAAAM
jgi:hypothetical protein